MKKTQRNLVPADRGPAIRRQTGLSLAGSHRISTGLKTSSVCQFNSIQSLSHVRLFATPWIAVCQASLSFTNFQSLLKLMSIELVMPSDHLSFVVPFSSCLQSLPASRSFPVSQFFASGGQSIGVSASATILPMSIQD